jgi:large subunit ribosomal protein L22
MRAYLKNYRQSPRKVRLVSDLIKGKSVVRASTQLNFLNKRASKVVGKLIDSAVSNAKENDSVNKDDLFVESIKVDEGPTLKRMRPRARGSAYLIRKRTSNITLELGKKVPKKAKVTKKTKSKK